jgi:Ca2+-binding RTX toxin-like protein
MIIDEIPTQTTEFDINNSYEKWILKSGSTLESQTRGIAEQPLWHDNIIAVNGKITASELGYAGIFSEGTNTSVTIGKSGGVNGYYGVDGYGESFNLVNRGTIHGEATAAAITGDDSRIVNFGGISGTKLEMYGDNNVLINHGAIQTQVTTIDADKLRITLDIGSDLVHSGATMDISSLAGETAHIVNKGIVDATTWAVHSTDGNETVINRGTMNGKIALGDGSDVFDNRGGKIDHAIHGEAGSDIFIIDSKTRIIEDVGGGGSDGIKSTISVSLSSGLYGGQEIENVFLLGSKNLHATGNGLAHNDLQGNAGDNVLSGMAGQDDLWGGRGNDRLTGGADDDLFYFKAHSDREVITDFTDGEDKLLFYAGKDITSVKDLLQHHTHQVGGDLVISGDGTEMVLQGVHRADFDSADFL